MDGGDAPRCGLRGGQAQDGPRRALRPGETRVEALGLDPFARLALAAMRGYCQGFAAPPSQGWLGSMQLAARHLGPPAATLDRARARPGTLEAAPVEAAEAEGDAVVVRLSEPFASLPALLTHASTVILAPASFDAAGEVAAVIGTGPFRVAEVSPPQSARLARLDDHWGEAPSLEAVD